MKTNIYNKVKKTGKRVATFLMAPMLLTPVVTSCLDTVILPDDITVGEDFWKRKNDVSQMVNAAYQGMTVNNVLERILVWGEARSDEFVRPTIEGAIPMALQELMSANTQVTNRYCTWSDFYAVINRCNIVLEKAASVLSEDPNYTEGDYLTDCSQMLALRSLCYFYLVRNFRDVPYVEEAYMSSSKERSFVQSSPLYVIDKCIESLEEASRNALKAQSYSSDDWRRVGWMTQDAIYALLADIHLWRASVLHSEADYQKAVDYCDLVIESKKSQHRLGAGEVVVPEYPLAQAKVEYNRLFARQNAEESIFELQIATANANTILCQYLYKYQNNTSTTKGYLEASSIFYDKSVSNVSTAYGAHVFPTNDIRLYGSIFAFQDAATTYNVRKMISLSGVENLSFEAYSKVGRTYGHLDGQNYIIYRLSDVMLMKAEAQVQLVDTVMAGLSTEERAAKQTVVDNKLREAFNLVQYVNTRSLLEANQADSMKWANLNSSRKGKTGMELLVMEERQRELCFESKRWYDLLRYNYRHVDQVNYNEIMGNIGLGGLPANYDAMLDLATRAQGEQKEGLKAKMSNEAYLYLPIPNSDLILSPGMKQNPAYGADNQYDRN